MAFKWVKSFVYPRLVRRNTLKRAGARIALFFYFAMP